MTNVSALAHYRMGRGITMRWIAKQASMSPVTVQKIERGEAVLKINCAKYFRAIGADFLDPATWPPGVQIIDDGVLVRISSHHE